MDRSGTIKALSKFHKLPICDGLEALATRNYNTAFPFHFHQTYNISLVYEGIFRTKVRERDLYAPSGAILITNPLEVHSNPCENNERFSFFTFYINPEFFSHSTKHTSFFRDNIIYDDELFRKLHRVAIRIEKEEDFATIEAELSHALQMLFSRYAPSDGGNDNLSNHHSLFKDYLSNENFDKFSLDQTAKQFGINKFKFLRLFKHQTGLTPNNYSILKRIEKSKEMLFAGQDLLSIAIDLGFYDIPHFSKHFKKFTGISPSVYSLASIPASNTLVHSSQSTATIGSQ